MQCLEKINTQLRLGGLAEVEPPKQKEKPLNGMDALEVARRKEHKRLLDKAWREKNRERKAASDKRYASEHKQTVRANQRRWAERNRDQILLARKAYNRTPARAEVAKRYYENNKHKSAARRKANRAVKKGILINPGKCENCPSTGPLQKHHDDYSKPLEVRWLCVPCHGAKSQIHP